MTDLHTAIEILCDDPAELRAVLGAVLDHPAIWRIRYGTGKDAYFAQQDFESRESARAIAQARNSIVREPYKIVPLTIRAAWEDRKRGIK